MTERCGNCGAELFEGQQFCRRCGAAVAAEGEDAPTRILPEGAPTSEPPATTSRLGARGTDPVRGPAPAGYGPPPPAFTPAGLQQTAPLAPARRGRGAWVVALVAVAALSVLATLGLVHAFRARSHQPVVIVKKGGEEKGLVPPPPPDLPARVREAVEAAGAALPVEEGDVTVSGDETTFTKSFRLDPGASFALRNVSGDVAVEGWERPEAEVTVVKSGGDARGRAATRVLASQAGGRLALTTAPAGHDVTVSYQIKLPRALRHVEVNVERGEVAVNDLDGAVQVEVKNGEVTLGALGGAVRGNLIRGDMSVAYGGARRREPQEFSVVRGNVTVELGERPSADLKAETMDGDIEVAEEFGPLRVAKTAAGGRHVAGRLAEGGPPLLVKVVNGDIALKQ